MQALLMQAQTPLAQLQLVEEGLMKGKDAL
jgi:hypothetical protein